MRDFDEWKDLLADPNGDPVCLGLENDLSPPNRCLQVAGDDGVRDCRKSVPCGLAYDIRRAHVRFPAPSTPAVVCDAPLLPRRAPRAPSELRNISMRIRSGAREVSKVQSEELLESCYSVPYCRTGDGNVSVVDILATQRGSFQTRSSPPDLPSGRGRDDVV